MRKWLLDDYLGKLSCMINQDSKVHKPPECFGIHKLSNLLVCCAYSDCIVILKYIFSAVEVKQAISQV